MAEFYELNGTVEHIVFQNEKNQYTVLELLTEDELVVVVGILPYISQGEEVKVIGEWTKHASFGTQFKASAFERRKPKTAAAMLKYLSGGAVKGVGPSTAQRIVDTFGENALEVIENEPERLAQIKGITKAKAREISEEIKKVYGIRELMLYLSGFGVKPEEAVRVWKMYGDASREKIRENPYCICEEFIGIDFAVADAVAVSMERPQEDLGRICAGIIYVLRHNANNGHTCVPAEKLAKTAARMLGITLEQAENAVILMCETGDLFCAGYDGTDYIFLPRYYRSELYIAERIRLMLRYPPRSIVGIDDEIREIEEREGVVYAERQKEAIRAALDKGILILTGGPGTGKTTTLNAIIRILKTKGETVFLAAPTGRAAKRMSELTGEEAKTIHRMLQVDWDENDNPVFIRNEGNPLECDAVVIDELSMVDTVVMEGVLSALPLGCRLVMVGDRDQLPSVGPGNMIGDLIRSGKIPTVGLTEIFRQARESLIVMNAHAIVKGRMPELRRVDSDFFFMPILNEEKLVNTVLDLFSTRLPATYGYNPVEQIQILCPGRKGAVGTENLNRLLRERINPPSPGKRQTDLMGVTFREGDKVMQVRNDYELPWSKEDGTTGEGVFNGDMGTITEIDKAAGIVRVLVDDKEAVYEFEKAGQELEHAYAVTVHKSQGNEFNAVIIPLYKGTEKLKYRNLLYTGITRAREILVLAGDRRVVEEMVENDRKTLRYTGLSHMLAEESGDQPV